ncbi:DUF3613 domain-containing protein [Comamonas sp. CMM03]|uniref:DUF3613 domain-containing protein n=1 Tax=Comamonas sp. CMM03 TaxID=2854781 RepID=UPI001C444E99|nr:DUF3613 domain-containing protein [Comamonas sp. CMM03]MBV7420576.1 DUF3613 domain-containing protein [Comamonas sp. CMM03]
MICKPMWWTLVLVEAGSVSAQTPPPALSTPPQAAQAAPVVACAAPPCLPLPGTAPTAMPVGQATRALLQQQAATEPSRPPQPMAGVVAQKVYARYVDSFAHPIPERAASPMAKK